MSADLDPSLVALLDANEEAVDDIIDSKAPDADAKILDLYKELLPKVFSYLHLPTDQLSLLQTHMNETIQGNTYLDITGLLSDYKDILRGEASIENSVSVESPYALIISWGMGNQLSQMIPQDPDYAEVFDVYPTVILVFETELWGSTGTKDLFSDEAKARIQAIFKHTFGVDPVLRQVSPICLSFSSGRHTLLLIKRFMSIPLLITQYLPLIQNAAHKDLICNDFGFTPCKFRYQTFSFFHQFGSMFYNYGDITPDLSPFKGRSQSGRISKGVGGSRTRRKKKLNWSARRSTRLHAKRKRRKGL
jgi:hypothetical protein